MDWKGIVSPTSVNIIVEMKVKCKKLKQYRCWLCGCHLPITLPPYQRNHNTCHCEEQGLPGGSTQPPRDWTVEQIDEARREWKESQT